MSARCATRCACNKTNKNYRKLQKFFIMNLNSSLKVGCEFSSSHERKVAIVAIAAIVAIVLRGNWSLWEMCIQCISLVANN